jgi:D-tyrosyl-tRNA(Tyr) deacylase
MRIVLQRVKEARLSVQGEANTCIGPGMLLLVGFGREDDLDLPHTKAWSKFLDKIVSLRIFPDDKGRTELSLKDIQGSILVVSQFTLYADWRKGRRPSFTAAASPHTAQKLFYRFVHDLSQLAPGSVSNGEFGAEVDILLCNWGPFTLSMDSQNWHEAQR